MAAAIRFPSLLSSTASSRHSVGCVDLMHRNLLVRLFYPTAVVASPDPADLLHTYCQWLPSHEYASGFIDMVRTLIPSMPLPPADVLMSPSMNALHKAPLKLSSPLSSSSPSVCDPSPLYPVAILSHGLGGNRCMYSSTSMSLASMGYVVANVEHRDQSASTSLQRVPPPGQPDGAKERRGFEGYVNTWIPFNKNCGIGRFEKNVTLRQKQVKIRRQDMSEALDLLQLLNVGSSVDNMTVEEFDYTQFTGQLNTEQCFVIGHSFGGATVIHSLYEDKRFRCGVALDPNLIPVHDEVYENGIDQPLMTINSEIGYQWKDNVDNIKRLLKNTTEGKDSQTPVVTLRGTTHFGFCDFPHAVPSYGNQPLDVNLHLELVMNLTTNFAKKFLSQECNNECSSEEHSNENIISGFSLKD